MTSATIPSSSTRTARADLATGVGLHYVEQGNPVGRPVILLHGYSDASLSFAPILPLLPPQLRLFVLDQRGHGESDRPLMGYAPRDLAADVIAFMDALGVARAAVVGHSMGTPMARSPRRSPASSSRARSASPFRPPFSRP